MRQDELSDVCQASQEDSEAELSCHVSPNIYCFNYKIINGTSGFSGKLKEKSIDKMEHAQFIKILCSLFFNYEVFEKNSKRFIVEKNKETRSDLPVAEMGPY